MILLTPVFHLNSVMVEVRRVYHYNLHHRFRNTSYCDVCFRSVGVSNFGIHHLEGLKAAGLPSPSVNQIELHPWQNTCKATLIKYCRDNNIVVMGYSPVVRMHKHDDPIVNQMAARYFLVR